MRIDERDIDVIAKEVYELSVTKGWWQEGSDRNFGEVIALIHSEISEALESKRNGEGPIVFTEDKPDGWAIELADAVIRIMDLFVREGLSLGECIQIKHNYNKSRPYRHGGKKF